MTEAKPREPNPIYLLATYFVTEILGRTWTATDNKGIHLRQAKTIFAEYSTTDIIGCLEAWRDGLLGDFPPWPPQTLASIRYGEPPMIEQWKFYRDNPPPIYLEESRNEWIKRTRRSNEDGERGDADLSLRQREVRPAVRPPED